MNSHRMPALAALATLGFLSYSSEAQSLVNVSLSSQATPGDITGAGVLGTAADQWNEIGAASVQGEVIDAGVANGLLDAAGTATGLSFAWSAEFQQHNPDPTGFGIDNPSGVAPVVNSWFVDDIEFSADPTYTIGGFSNGDVVDLVLYGAYHFPTTLPSGFNRGVQFDITSGDTGNVSGALSTIGVDGTSTTLIDSENFVQFNDLIVGPSGEIEVTLSPSSAAGQNGGAFGRFFDINGFQVAVDTTPIALEMEVNTVTGLVSIVNPTAGSISINDYQITSAGGALDASSWNSLEDQSQDAIDGPDPGATVGDSPGETWLEAGGTAGLQEGFLLGSTTIDAGESLSLGTPFDVSVFGSGNDGDLQFSYASPGGGIINGLVAYDDTPPPGLPGDYNGDGVVDAADYTVWRDNLGSTTNLAADGNGDNIVDAADYQFWRARYGNTLLGQASVASAPEPAACLLLMTISAMLAALRRPPPAVKYRAIAAICVLASFAVCDVASAAVYNDRVYRLGDDGEEDAANAPGNAVGAGPGNVAPGRTLDSGEPGDPSGTKLDLNAFGSPVYDDVSTIGGGRPGSSVGDLGISFDGSDDVLFGAAVNIPEEMVALPPLNGVYPFNYTGLTARGLQVWVYPEQAGLNAGVRQGIVMDTIVSGGVSITADGNWTQTNAGHTNDTDINASVGVIGDQWRHVMHHTYTAFSPNRPLVVQGTGDDDLGFTSVVYVDGIAVSANNDQLSQGDFDLGSRIGVLAVGAEEVASLDDVNPEFENYFQGTVDDLEVYVFEDNSSEGGQNYGPFELFSDNEWIANEIATTVPGGVLQPGDVDRDGGVDADDVTAFVAGWLSEKRFQGAHNVVTVGDWETWGWGDMNHDGRVRLDDAFILHQALAATGAGGLDFSLLNSAAAPEPSASILIASLTMSFAGLRGKRRANSLQPAAECAS